MALDILRFGAATSPRLNPVAPRLAPLFCLALLIGGCALASFGLACATPFAAFAVVAAAMLPLRSALVVMAGAWLVNQAIGFACLGYPGDANTLFLGLSIGAAALLATAASALVLRFVPRTRSPAALGLALFAAYAVYEVVLFAFTPVLGGADTFTPAIVARLGLLDVVWLIGLLAACEVVRLLAAARRQQIPS